MVWYGMVWYGMEWHGIDCHRMGNAWFEIKCYGMAWHGMGWYDIVCNGIAWYVLYGMVWYVLTWLKYCRYGAKLHPINHSINHGLSWHRMLRPIMESVGHFLAYVSNFLSRLPNCLLYLKITDGVNN